MAIPVHAQLGEADLDGLHINARYVFLTGDTRNPDCTVSLSFWGRKLGQDAQLAPVHLFRAMDEATQIFPHSKDAFSGSSGSWQTFVLKGVSHATKSLTLEGELELLTPATPYPVFTNFMEHLGEVFQHPLLEQNGIKVTCTHLEGTPQTDFQIRVEDPRKKFLGVEFQWPDGGDVGVIKSKGSSSFDNKSTTFTYHYPEITPKNSNLKVRINVSKKSEKIPFRIAIRPPWVTPEDLQVKVVGIDQSPDRGTNTRSYFVRLAFVGASLTNAVAIGKIQIIKAESDTGAACEIKNKDQWWFDRFAVIGTPGTTDSGIASTTIPLHIQPAQAASIRILEGDAAVFRPNSTNHGIVELGNIFAIPETIIDDPALKENGVRITYLGRANFRAKTNEWHRSQTWIRTFGGFYDAPTNVEDSILFSIDDPKGRMIPGISLPEFLDEKGSNLAAQKVALSSNYCLIAFGTLPRIAKARIYLCTPEALQRVHFKVENVALP